jgi:predicted nucleic acid-binding protein
MLLDTSGLLCLLDSDDSRHADAWAFFEAAEEWVTHDYVLAELVPLCRSRGVDLRIVLNFLNDLLEDPRIEVVWTDEWLCRSALSLLQGRMDKSYSLCDAVSFLLMQRRGVTEALTTDRHFSQEGFQRLLKP